MIFLRYIYNVIKIISYGSAGLINLYVFETIFMLMTFDSNSPKYRKYSPVVIEHSVHYNYNGKNYRHSDYGVNKAKGMNTLEISVAKISSLMMISRVISSTRDSRVLRAEESPVPAGANKSFVVTHAFSTCVRAYVHGAS